MACPRCSCSSHLEWDELTFAQREDASRKFDAIVRSNVQTFGAEQELKSRIKSAIGVTGIPLVNTAETEGSPTQYGGLNDLPDF